MISVTGYCNGSPLVYGRGETEEEARKNAHAYADQVSHRFPRLSDPRCWDFKRDVADRQLFQSAAGACGESEAEIAARDQANASERLPHQTAEGIKE